ncbi:MAG: repeat protein, partial [Verrucomicrobiales bacterium]|nr:repeat protein [Verrucomicrobiales bacterium]
LFSSSTVTVLFGQGDGTFVEAPGSPYAVGSGPTGVVAVDLDGVNGPDIVTADQFDNQLSVLMNNGDGTFATPVAISVGQNPVWVEALDLDGDHKTDLITANSFDNTLTVLINNGSGGFTTSSTIPVGAYPFYVRAADINGDLKPDLISVNSDDGTLTVLTNSGAGVFTLAQTLMIGSSPSAVTATDIDGDGRLDLISADTGDDTLTVLTNSNGAFTVFTRFAGDGSNLKGLNAGNLTGSISDLLLSSNVPLLDGDLQQFTKRNAFLDLDNGFYGTFIGTHPDSFVGDGSFLTNLDASTLFGTIDDSLLSANVPFLSGTNSFSGTNEFSGVTIAGNTANQFAGTFTGNGSAITDLDGAHLTDASVPVDKLSPTFGYFYLKSPPDAATIVFPGDAFPFLRNGPASGIPRNGVAVDEFVLPAVGVYEISWQISITEAGQLVLALDGVEQDATVVGRDTGSTQIMGNALLETTNPNTVLTVRNPAGNATALTVMPNAGGASPSTGSLVIKRIK